MSDSVATGGASVEDPPKKQAPRVAIIADLNVDPPESDGEGDGEIAAVPDSSARSSNDDLVQVKNSITVKDSEIMEIEDGDQQSQGVSSSREEKVSSLKAGLVHVARKMPKNAHSHFLLGLMYQRLGQPQKAVLAFEKSSEILLQSEEEIRRPEFLSLVQIHHAQCIFQANAGDNSDKELEADELQEILSKLKESVLSDVRQATIWNTLGVILLRTGRMQSAISVLSSLLDVAPDYLDAIANLGIAYLQSGNMELSENCFQNLILKDQNHPAAFINYAAFLLSKHGSIVAGAGANGEEGISQDQLEAANVAKQCLLAAAKAEPKAGLVWLNLANAYSIAGEHQKAKKCLEQAARLEPHHMSTRYAIAVHRIKDAERCQDPNIQLSWAVNEMFSIIKDGDPAVIDLPTAWAGLAMAHKAQHEISAAFETPEKTLSEAKECAVRSLKQAIEVDVDDSIPWHQLGLHDLCTLQFSTSQKFLKAAIARNMQCCYAWSNLGVSIQLSQDPLSAETVYKRALALATPEQAHAILSNMGNLYRQQKEFEHAKKILQKCLEFSPGYAPAYNNLGLVYIAEGQWEEARGCFQKAMEMDQLLDAAKSNLVKTPVVLRDRPL